MFNSRQVKDRHLNQLYGEIDFNTSAHIEVNAAHIMETLNLTLVLNFGPLVSRHLSSLSKFEWAYRLCGVTVQFLGRQSESILLCTAEIFEHNARWRLILQTLF